MKPLKQLGYLGISALTSAAIVFVLKEILMWLYKYTTLKIINLTMAIYYMSIGRGLIFKLGIWLILMSAIFIVISMKENKRILKEIEHRKKLEEEKKEIEILIDKLEELEKDELESLDEEEYKNDAKILAVWINKIIHNLREKTEEEKRAQKTKADLITNISHDLKTPLTSIIGYLRLIDEDKYKDEMVLRSYTDIAYEKAKRLNILVNDLFHLTKIQNGGVKLDKREINLVELVSQLIVHYKVEALEKEMIIREIFPAEKIKILADGNNLIRALENILVNSMKYGNDGIYIDVEVKRENEKAIIKISNYGNKIEEYDLENIFERFYRVDKSRNSKIEGSGLGLSISKSIIELHNGKIKAVSTEEKTSFIIEMKIN